VGTGWQPRAAALVACALIATSVGLVGPLLKDAGLLTATFGRLTLAGAALGEVAAIVLISVGFSVSHGPADALAVLVFVVVLARGYWGRSWPVAWPGCSTRTPRPATRHIR
jgi:Kef-type K+ transport system membrane component KefB